uniref:Ribosome assembly factor mrt4 n=1 Tax=Lotharella globosa TaxID=91324 RepID=A0A6U3AJ90_9EUKA
MPKSKRAKIVHLTRVKKKGREKGDKLIEEVRDLVDEFSHIYLYQVENMRNSAFKDLRILWPHSRFIFGRNKLMMVALGVDEEDEYRTGLAQLAKGITGTCGLLFTNRESKEVRKYFAEFREPQYARTGCIATKKFVIKPGLLPGLPVSMEPQLRKKGLPVRIQKGKLELVTETVVCKEGTNLTPEQCSILEMFEVKMVDFRINILGCYTDEKYVSFQSKSAGDRKSNGMDQEEC